MKRKLFAVLTVVFVLVMNTFNVAAFENEFMKIEIPEVFSSYVENTIEGTDVKQWTDPADSSNVGITVLKNDGISYADLTDYEISTIHSTIIAQLNADVTETLKSYSIEFNITDSSCNNYEINGIKGVEILYDSEYLYPDGSVMEATNYMYMFASSENAVTISATVNSEEKIPLIEDMMNSFEFFEEIYVSDGETDFSSGIDWYSVIKSAALGGCAGGIAVLLVSMLKKRKKDKSVSETYTPVNTDNSDENKE